MKLLYLWNAKSERMIEEEGNDEKKISNEQRWNEWIDACMNRWINMEMNRNNEKEHLKCIDHVTYKKWSYSLATLDGRWRNVHSAQCWHLTFKVFFTGQCLQSWAYQFLVNTKDDLAEEKRSFSGHYVIKRSSLKLTFFSRTNSGKSCDTATSHGVP